MERPESEQDREPGEPPEGASPEGARRWKLRFSKRDKFRRDSSTVSRGFWDKLRRTLGRVPFSEDAAAAYYCARDPKTPFQVKAILMGALAYFVVPSDMMPDVLPLLGFTDDATVLYAAIRSVLPHVKETHRDRARLLLDKGIPAEGPAATEGGDAVFDEQQLDKPEN